MGEMAAGLAHQLRTPLATALLYAGNLTRRSGWRKRDRLRFAEKALGAPARSRADDPGHADVRARRARSRTSRFELRELLHELAQVMEPQMARHEACTSQSRCRCVGAHVRGNRKALCGALRQSAGKRAAGERRRRRGALAERSTSRDACHSVCSDSGEGMSPEVQRAAVRAVLHHAHRGHRAGARDRAQRGRMRTAARCRSTAAPGRGTTFMVQPALPAGSRRSGTCALKPLPVLIVEDDASLARSAAATRSSCRVIEVIEATRWRGMRWSARTGARGDRGHRRADAADGRRAAAARDQAPLARRLPVLLMTAYGMIDRAVEAMRAGACNYLAKPFEPDAAGVGGGALDAAGGV